jgi:hypothetical protein
MAKLSVFTDSEQLSLDDVLAEFRDEAPPEVVAAIPYGASVITGGDVSQAKIGTVSHNGLCPYMQECYQALGLVHQHCAWNLDDPPTWRFCGGYKRRQRRHTR